MPTHASFDAAGDASYRLLFSGNPIPMMVFDEETLRILEVNEACVRLYGWSCAEFARMTVADIRPPEEVPTLQRMVKLDADCTRVPGRHRHWKKDGTVFDVEVTPQRLPTRNGWIRLAMIEDVTERAANDRALRTAYEAVRTLVERSPLAIVAVDTRARVTMWNEAAEAMFGYSATEVIGQPLPLIPEERAEERAHLERILLDGSEGLRNVATQRVRRDGVLVDVLLSTATLHGPDGHPQGSVAFMTDLTQQRQLELQLRQAQKMDAVGRLAGGVAHDFNNLLQVITSCGELLSLNPALDDVAREDVREIGSAAARAAALTRQLLSFSRRATASPQAISAAATIEAMERLIRRLLGDGITLSVDVDPGDHSVVIDRGSLEQVVLNLAVNARDAMPGGGLLEVTVGNLTPDRGDSAYDPPPAAGDYVRISVRDTGKGMDAATQQHIFEPFFTTKPPGEGTGLGLATVYGIVRHVGGSIRVTSAPGAGSCFDVLIPRAKPCAARCTPAGESEATAGRPAACSILVVDDEPALRTMAQRLLERSGHDVRTARSGREALEIIETSRDEIALVVSDVVMPEMGGAALHARMRELGIATPVIFMSGYAAGGSLPHRTLPAGSALLQKPFSGAELEEAVRTVLGGD